MSELVTMMKHELVRLCKHLCLRIYTGSGCECSGGSRKHARQPTSVADGVANSRRLDRVTRSKEQGRCAPVLLVVAHVLACTHSVVAW